MIKNLLEQHANQPDKIEPENETLPPPPPLPAAADAPQYVEVNEAEDLFENVEKPDVSAASETREPPVEYKTKTFVEPADETENFIRSYFDPPTEKTEPSNETINAFSEKRFDSSEIPTIEAKNIQDYFPPTAETEAETETQTFTLLSETIAQEVKTERDEAKIENEEPKTADNEVIARSDAPQSFAETARQNGLAYAAAITLFGSVIFMLIIGWFADLLFGSSPWGKVGGIALGSLIGLIQLFRITSQIFKK